jgi:hypothetical protein
VTLFQPTVTRVTPSFLQGVRHLTSLSTFLSWENLFRKEHLGRMHVEHLTVSCATSCGRSSVNMDSRHSDTRSLGPSTLGYLSLTSSLGKDSRTTSLPSRTLDPNKLHRPHSRLSTITFPNDPSQAPAMYKSLRPQACLSNNSAHSTPS